jgi:hypothetical protein
MASTRNSIHPAMRKPASGLQKRATAWRFRISGSSIKAKLPSQSEKPSLALFLESVLHGVLTIRRPDSRSRQLTLASVISRSAPVCLIGSDRTQVVITSRNHTGSEIAFSSSRSR